MSLMIENRSLIAGVITLLSVGLIVFHFSAFGKPAQDYWWVEYGLLVYSTYIIVAYVFNWTIHVAYTSYPPTSENRAWRIVALLTGLFIYALALYMLFFG